MNICQRRLKVMLCYGKFHCKELLAVVHILVSEKHSIQSGHGTCNEEAFNKIRL